MTGRFIDADGLRLFVRTEGRGDAVLLLHGFTGDSTTVAELGVLVGEGRRLVIPDLVGHGRSDKPMDIDSYRMERLTDAIAALCAALGVDRVDIVGYSMGGRIALHLAAAQPDLVRSLALIGATAGLTDARERAARVESDERLASFIMREGIEAFVDYWTDLPLFETQRSLDDSRRASMRRQRLRNDPIGLALTLRGSGTGTMEPLHGRLAEWTVPMLWITGSLDPKFDSIADETAQTNSSVDRARIADAGHAAHIEQPAAVAASILDFWSRRVPPNHGAHPHKT